MLARNTRDHSRSVEPELVAKAGECIDRLTALQSHASKPRHEWRSSDSKKILDDVSTSCANEKLLLREWRESVTSSGQTTDENAIRNVQESFNLLEKSIQAVEDALGTRLALRYLMPRTKHNANDDVRQHLTTLHRDVEILINQRTLASNQEPVKAERREVLAPRSGHRRTRWYESFVNGLNCMTIHDKQHLQFGARSDLWNALKELEPVNLKRKHVGSSTNPGDSFIFGAAQLDKAANIVQDYYEAWSKSIVESCQQEAATQQGLPKVGTVTKLAQICLVLNLIDKPSLLDRFCTQDYSDLTLPISENTLLRIFEDEKEAQYHTQRFSTEQYRVASRNWTDGKYIEIPAEEPLPFILEREYHSGSYATVHGVRNPHTESKYALKKQKIDHKSADGNKHFESERNTLGRLNHRHVVRYTKAFKRGEFYYFLLDPAADGNLNDLLREYREEAPRSRKKATKIRKAIMTVFGCMGLTLCDLHSREKVIHKDIKPSNILYHEAHDSHETQVQCNILLADFGLAYDYSDATHTGTADGRKFSGKYAAPGRLDTTWISSDRPGFTSVHDDDAVSFNTIEAQARTSADGSADKKPPHGRKDDVFMLGCVFFELLSALVNSSIPDIENAEFELSEKGSIVKEWAKGQIRKEGCSELFKFLFTLTINMTIESKDDRLDSCSVFEELKQSQFAKELFCLKCQSEAKI